MHLGECLYIQALIKVLKSHKAAPIVVKELAGDVRGLLGLSASWDF